MRTRAGTGKTSRLEHDERPTEPSVIDVDRFPERINVTVLVAGVPAVAADVAGDLSDDGSRR
jgi:hypothetical protein